MIDALTSPAMLGRRFQSDFEPGIAAGSVMKLNSAGTQFRDILLS
ncbi:MAG: hypothetical protein V4710_21610 [Verrucomicrobiota bacterium]